MLWVGQSVSAVGSAMSAFMYPVVGYALTGSAVAAAAAGSAHLLGKVVAGLPAGALVDRWDRRTVIVCSAGAGAVLYSTLVLAMLAETLVLGHFLAVAAGTGVAGAFLHPAEGAAVRQIVPAPQLPSALAQTEARQHAAELMAPPTAGLLYAAARWAPFLVDALSYLVAACTAAAVRTDLAPPPSASSRRRMRDDVKEGLRFVWDRSFLRAVALAGSVVNAAMGATFLVLTLRLLDGGIPEAVVGGALSVGSVAGLLGACAAPVLIRQLPTGRLVATAALLAPTGLAPLAFTDDPVLVALFLGIALVGLPAINAGTFSYVVAVTPDRLQGRVNSALVFTASIAQPLGPLTGGLLLTLLDGRLAMLAATAVMTAGVLLLIGNRQVLALPRPDQWAVEDGRRASSATQLSRSGPGRAPRRSRQLDD